VVKVPLFPIRLGGEPKPTVEEVEERETELSLEDCGEMIGQEMADQKWRR
jgi:hypothetical protein